MDTELGARSMFHDCPFVHRSTCSLVHRSTCSLDQLFHDGALPLLRAFGSNPDTVPHDRKLSPRLRLRPMLRDVTGHLLESHNRFSDAKTQDARRTSSNRSISLPDDELFQPRDAFSDFVPDSTITPSVSPQLAYRSLQRGLR